MDIVIVDDDFVHLRTLETHLIARGHSVRSFENPLFALAYLRSGEFPDALVVDFTMPDLRGDQLLAQIRWARRKDTKVILMSGLLDIFETLDWDELGHTTFMQKPLDLSALVHAIEDVPRETSPPTDVHRQQMKGET